MTEKTVQWNRKELADLILARLEKEKEKLKKEFASPGRINSCYIDNLLPENIAQTIYNAFPSPEEMAIHKSIRENKRVAAQMNLYHPLLEEIVFAFQDKRIVNICEYITGLKEMHPDEQLYAG